MATEKQFQFFQSLYLEETDRAKSLRDRGNSYLSLVTLYSAFVIFVAEKMRPTDNFERVLFSLTMGAMVTAFVVSLWANRIASFQIAIEPRDIITELGKSPPTDAEFFDDRILDYVLACEQNSKINDGKAEWLSIAGYCLLLAIALHACYFLFATI